MKESWSLPASIKTSTGYSIIPKGPGPWISMKNTWKIQQNASMTQTLIRLLLVASISKSWAITDLFHASLLSRTKNRRYQKATNLRMEKNWPSASRVPPKNQQKLKSSTQQTAKNRAFLHFSGGETNKPIARKNADFKQVAGKLPAFHTVCNPCNLPKINATTRWPRIRGRFSGFSLEAIMEPRNWLFQCGGNVDLSRIWR